MSRRKWISDTWDRVHPSNLLYSTYEARLLAELDRDKIPQHVAVMADGNRRWARMNAPGQPLVAGYRAGAAKLNHFSQWCAEVGIPLVTLWVLSTDNLARGKAEELEPLLEVIAELFEELARQGDWQIQAVGDLKLLPTPIADRIRAATASTAEHTGMHINIAVSYGGRYELRDAVRSLLGSEAAKGNTLEQLSQELEIDQIAEHLYTKGQPDPDLVIRTSGEQRMSGFLIWQSAHSEFYFHEALWPDFRKVDFIRALRSYTQRERRFGK